MKGHLAGVKAVIYCYILAVCLGWASYPILIFLTFVIPLDISQSIYTLIATLVFCVLLYISMHEIGFKDRKPVAKARYASKGFVCGGIAFAAVVLVEILVILMADRYFTVKHPVLEISNVNEYVRLLFYMPFYWLYKLLDPASDVVPSVGYLTCLIPGIIIIPVSGCGYLMGFKSKRLLNKDIRALKNKFMYRGDKKD